MIPKVLSVATFSCIAICAGYAQPNTVEAASIQFVRTDARIVRSANMLPAEFNQPVRWGDSVQTNGNGRLRLQLTDGSVVTLGETTDLTLQSPARLTSTQGQFRATLAGSTHEIQTPAAFVSSSGGDVAVQITPSGKTNVICLEGSAEIRSADPAQPGAVTCDAGEIVVVKPGSAPLQPQLVDERTVLLWRNITDPDQAPPFQPFP